MRDDTHERCEIAEGAIITAEVEVVGYIPPEGGEMQYGLRYGAEAPISTLLGLLEFAKSDMITYARSTDEPED